MENTTPSPTFEVLQALWAAQPRALRLFTPDLSVRWDNLPDRLERLPLYKDESGRAALVPPEGPVRNAWPVARALAEGTRCMRNYPLQCEGEAAASCYRVLAYPLALPGEGTLIVEETERVDKAMCHDERLKGLDGQLSEMMAGVTRLLSGRTGSEPLRLRLANPNLQPCYQIRGCPMRECPAYESENLRCWEINGTLCHDDAEYQEDVLGKFEYCSRCNVYLLACPDPLTRVGEHINRLLSFLQFKYDESIEMHRQIQQSEKLAALGELTMGIVHEIKNPLSILASRLDCLALELDPRDGARLDRDLVVLRNQIARMQQFLEELLAFARPAEVAHRPLEINEVIRNTLPLLSKTLEKAHLRLDRRLAEGLPQVSGDPVSIQQILINLMLNARDATPAGGAIRIRSRLNPRNEGEVLVEVSDSGHGIAPGEIKRIFSPFYSSKTSRGGTGLGLAVCSRIMTQHGGHIQARSRLRKGTTFVLSFKSLAAGQVGAQGGHHGTEEG